MTNSDNKMKQQGSQYGDDKLREVLLFPREIIAKIESVVAGQAPITLEWKNTPSI